MTNRLLAKAPKSPKALFPITKQGLKPWLAGDGAAWRGWVEGQAFTGAAGQLLVLPNEKGAPTAAVCGVDEDAVLWSFAALPAKLPAGSYRLTGDWPAEWADSAALGWLLGCYHYDRYKKRPKSGESKLVMPKGTDGARAEALSQGISLTRDLISTPANDMGPADLAAVARSLARRHKASIKLTVGDALLKQNYPAIHAVGRASADAPRLIDLRWGKKGPKITLVGKGVCFDSGGLDIKSAAGMKLMKKDMGGGAHVLGLAETIMALKLPVRLRVLVPAVENAISGNAFRPMDIIDTRQGLTIEIGNTDAEGRLILSDALTEASSEDPAMIIDFATLTGAARIALGTDLPAMFCNNDDLAGRLEAAGEAEGDPLWRLPLHRPYRRMLDSKFADMNNAPSGGYGGAITAALFLQEFVKETVPWAHFDIMAWNTASKPGRPEGGEAMAFRAVFRVIEDLAAGK